MTDDITRLTNELAIRNLISRIARLSDEGDLEEYADQFTEDAVWDFPLGPRHGRADILEGARTRRAAATTGPGTKTRHVLTNVVVDVGDDGTATADSYLLFVDSKTPPPSIAVCGTYHDTFVREGSTWRLARRDIAND